MTNREKLKKDFGIVAVHPSGAQICVNPDAPSCDVCKYLQSDVLGYLRCNITEWLEAEYEGGSHGN